MGPRDINPQRALGDLHHRIKAAKVLMVGAGGIGCELLKNLVLTGFGEVHIVDLDTIDLSNLNRQFLFGMQHIKKSKAMVAKETAGKFNPNVKLQAYHANIKDAQFNVKWYKSFDIVFNALDNLDARRHVNRMCLAANVPLIESGTTGFNGQVQAIKKGVTECYDCTFKPVPKSFPVCTIRSTPSQPIHCIVWAKSYLFPELFGTSEDDSPELDHTEDAENSEEIENLRKESQELKNIRSFMGTSDFTRHIFEKVFGRDIHRLRGMEEMWISRKPPVALEFEQVAKKSEGISASGCCANDQRVWSLQENFAVFEDSLKRLSVRARELEEEAKGGEAPPLLSFDKDDVDTLDFVTAAANLRSCVFGIELKSRFDVKQMAGNIIPAIATTNAITAGVCVLQSFKILADNLPAAKMVFLSRSSERIFATSELSAPNPACEVCGVASCAVEVDLERATLGDLVNEFVRKGLGYGKTGVSVLTDQLLYDYDFDDNLAKKLKEVGIGEGTFVTVIDEGYEDDDEDEDEDGEGGRERDEDGNRLPVRVNLVLSVIDKRIPDSLPSITPPDPTFIVKRKQPSKLDSFLDTPPPNTAPPSIAGTKRGHTADADVMPDAEGSENVGESGSAIGGNGDSGSNGNGSAKKRRLNEATADLTIRDGGEAGMGVGMGKGKVRVVDREVVVVDDDGVIEID